MRNTIILLCAAVAISSTTALADKGTLVLQVGRDWCVSGEDVRKAFESDAFRRAVGSKFDLLVYDDMDEPDEKTAAANKKIKDRVVRTKRFPAITCLTQAPARFFAQLENIPNTASGERLAEVVLKLSKRKDAAEKLFRDAASMRTRKPDEAANAYGQAFEIIMRQVGEFNEKSVREGPLAYAAEWKALCELDADEKYGWKRRFTMGSGIDLVTKANKFREDGDFAGGESFIASLRRIPQDHLTPNQRQCIDMAEYALWRKDGSRADSNVKLLEHAFSLGRDTFWGQSAMGYLNLAGRKIERKPFKRAKLAERPAHSGSPPPPFPLPALERKLASLTPKAELNDARKKDIAMYAVLRRIGQEGWHALLSRPGSEAFVSAFFKDRTWMEDFAWSGPCKGEKAILALESLVFQDGGKWIGSGDTAGRRFATAVALEYPSKDEAWLADFLDAYRATAIAGRLHKRALSQPVWQWRFAVHQGQRSASVDDAPTQQRFLSNYVNMPQREYGGACWMVPYRSFNCFGETVQGPKYYQSWEAAGDWPKRRYSPTVGGVCGELSKFGSACGNAHGLPSCTAGQPGHCAYTRRLANGKWEINYSVGSPTHMHVAFWSNSVWPYVQAYEGTFQGEREKRLDADRMIELAILAEGRGAQPKEIERFFQQACRSWPSHYNAWRAYGDWIARAKVPLATMKTWVRGCARGMRTGRQPVWDFLSPYFARLAAEGGAKALAETLVEFAPLLRQDGVKLQEEADFKAALSKWTEPIAKDATLVATVLKAMLSAQYGTRDYFSQTLGWGGDILMPSKGGTKAFMDVLEAVVAEKSSGGTKAKLDFAPLILSASKAGNMSAFRQLAQLQDRLEPVAKSGKSYPAKDFGEPLLSSEGMLRTSSTSQWDKPAKYTRCMDETPSTGNGFHTGKESSPWAVVALPGPADVCGVVVVNDAGSQNRSRQVPLEIQVSEDGEQWETVFSAGDVRETYRADLRSAPRRARQVRVRRTPKAKEEFFHLSKILVYGRKLY